MAPAGRPLIVIDNVSPGSASVNAALMVSGMGFSSAPLAALTLRLGASATPVTLIGKLALVLAVVPFSLLVAVTVSDVVPIQLAPGVRIRPLSSAGVMV